MEPASQVVEELEAIAVWGQELWRERGLLTTIKGAPEGSEWEGLANKDVLSKCEAHAAGPAGRREEAVEAGSG